MRRRRRAIWFVTILVIAVAGIVAVLAMNDVSTALTPDDEAFAERILRETGHGALLDQTQPGSFDSQIETIRKVQDAVLTTAPKNVGLPLGAPRELRDLYEAKAGLCFDRSRAIEKILSSLGFETRHAAVYSTRKANALTALLTSDGASHAVSEVKTKRGWIVVDSNRRWIALTEDGEPADLADVRAFGPGQAWSRESQEEMSPILGGPYTFLYGLYSRHGRFYPPFNAVPDIDWAQVPANFGG